MVHHEEDAQPEEQINVEEAQLEGEVEEELEAPPEDEK